MLRKLTAYVRAAFHRRAQAIVATLESGRHSGSH